MTCLVFFVLKLLWTRQFIYIFIVGIILLYIDVNHRKGDFIYLSAHDLKSSKLNNRSHFYKDPPRYLYTKLDDQSEKEMELLFEGIDNLEKQKEKFSINSQSETDKINDLYEKIIAITQNRKLQRYHLNIRGLLLYIVGEINLEIKDNRNYNRKIRTVLENLYIHHTNQFPFLEFYKEFNKEFTKIKSISSKYTYLEVEIIKEIAYDLSNQLPYTDINFLKYYVTKKYSITIVYNILEIINCGLLSISNELENMIKEYQLKNFKYLTTYLDKEKKVMEEHYNFLYNSQQIDGKIINQTNSFLNIYFQINQQY